MGHINDQELSEAFTDVRRAYRLLAQLQTRLQDIVFYICSKTKFSYSDNAGNKLFSNPISRHKVDRYASLRVFRDMWPWDFLYGYAFEYYFSNTRIGNKNCAMSIITICDDGYFISESKSKKRTNISSFASEEDSNSWIILVYGDGATNKCWMRDKEILEYLKWFFSHKKDADSFSDDKGHMFVAKKYLMQQFVNQTATDSILKDFAQIVEQKANVKILTGNEE